VLADPSCAARTIGGLQAWDLDRLGVAPHQPRVLRSDDGANRFIAVLLPEGESLQEHQVHVCLAPWPGAGHPSRAKDE
jgi:hypothetical protein